MERDCVRHGDLLFRPAAWPTIARHGEEAKPAELRRREGRIIQRGEVTGHAHRLTDGEAVILEQYERLWSRRRPGDGTESVVARFLDVATPATITHEEHKPVTLAPGLWEIIQAREFDYAANLGRRVRD